MTQNPTLSERLEPCPFCGSTDVNVEETPGVGQYVCCAGCQAQGPFVARIGDPDEAVPPWNRRTPAQPSTVTVEGWKLVPVNPTPSMSLIGCAAAGEDATYCLVANAAYRAMIAAAPTAPSPVTPERIAEIISANVGAARRPQDIAAAAAQIIAAFSSASPVTPVPQPLPMPPIYAPVPEHGSGSTSPVTGVVVEAAFKWGFAQGAGTFLQDPEGEVAWRFYVAAQKAEG